MFVTAGNAAVLYRLHATVMECGQRVPPEDYSSHTDIYTHEICGVELRSYYYEEDIGPEYSRERIHCRLEAPRWSVRWHSSMQPQRSGDRDAMVLDLTMCMLSGEIID